MHLGLSVDDGLLSGLNTKNKTSLIASDQLIRPDSTAQVSLAVHSLCSSTYLGLKDYFEPHDFVRFRRGVNEVFALLGCSGALIGSYRRFETVSPHSFFGTVYRSGCPETSVSN
jgi:hypothetical protein